MWAMDDDFQPIAGRFIDFCVWLTVEDGPRDLEDARPLIGDLFPPTAVTEDGEMLVELAPTVLGCASAATTLAWLLLVERQKSRPDATIEEVWSDLRAKLDQS